MTKRRYSVEFRIKPDIAKKLGKDTMREINDKLDEFADFIKERIDVVD